MIRLTFADVDPFQIERFRAAVIALHDVRCREIARSQLPDRVHWENDLWEAECEIKWIADVLRAEGATTRDINRLRKQIDQEAA